MRIDVIDKSEVPVEGLKYQKFSFATILKALKSHEAIRIPNQSQKVMAAKMNIAYGLNTKIADKENKWHTRVVKGILYLWKGELPQSDAGRFELEVKVIKKKLPVKA